MKILKIKASGLKLFDKEINIDFYAKQRVSADKNEMLTNIYSNIYINNVMSMVGINASGKTTLLKFVSFVLQVLQNKPINSIDCRDVLEGLEDQNEVCLDVYFINDREKVTRLNMVIKAKINQEGLEGEYYIANEKIWTKSLGSVRSKNDLFVFSDTHSFVARNNEEQFLLDDVSMIIAFNKNHKEKLFVIDTINWTNINGLRYFGYFPIELVQFLDPSIEYLTFTTSEKDKKTVDFRLKFFGRKEITIYSLGELNRYLSSGTIKGISIFIAAIITFQKGGYFIIDELENHFNKEIVSTLIRFFMDNEINKKGAVLLFSTHYIELLDIFDRNDNVFIIKNKNGIIIENLSDLLKRNDVKKSELFQSGYLEHTTPSYESYISFKRALVKLTEASGV